MKRCRVLLPVLVCIILAGCVELRRVRPHPDLLAHHLNPGYRITVHLKNGERVETEYRNVTGRELITKRRRYPLTDISHVEYDAADPNVARFLRTALPLPTPGPIPLELEDLAR